jgi:hypothetical protein
MSYCNVCGSRKNKIKITSALDGNVCEQCVERYFIRDENGNLIPVYYNKGYLLEILHSLNIDTQKAVFKAFKEIQSRYTYVIRDFIFDGVNLQIMLNSRHRKQNCIIYVVCNNLLRSCRYEILTEKALSHSYAVQTYY